MKTPLIAITALAIGSITTLIATGYFNQSAISIDYIPPFEIDTTLQDELISVKGSYISSDSVHIVSLDCYLVDGTCIESSSYVSKEGLSDVFAPKTYEIIEQSPTRIVAEYYGLATTHSYVVDLASEKVTFKNKSNTDPTDVATYDLVDGQVSLVNINN